MKIKVELTIDVDRETWYDTYGNDDVRQDVKEYVLYSVLDMSGIQETGATVTLKR